MSYYIARFAFLVTIAITLFGTACALSLMVSGEPAQAYKALATSVMTLLIAMWLHWECSEETLPEYRYQYHGK